jgi:hypothetical protein
VGLALEVPNKDTTITLSFGGKDLVLPVHHANDDTFFWIPAADQTWPDDALIHYSDPAPVVSRRLQVRIGFDQVKTGE